MKRLIVCCLLLFATLYPALAQLQRSTGVIATLRAVNMNATGDKTFNIPPQVTTYTLTQIVITNCSTNMTTARIGFFSGAGATGDTLMANTVITGLTGSTDILLSAVTQTGDRNQRKYTASVLYANVSVAQGAAATCDLYLIGIDLT